MTTDAFVDLQELASLRLARRFDESARIRMEAISHIREKAAANGLLESSGVVWGRKLAVIGKQLSDRALAIAQVWHDLIKETRGDFSDEAHAFVVAHVERATEVHAPIEVEGARPPAGLEQHLVDAARNAGHAAKAWLAERRAEARLRPRSSSSSMSSAITEPRDALTGLRDRGALDAALSAATKAAADSGEPLSLAMIDLDNFKRINDTHGHQVGDGVLKEVARRIERAVHLKGAAFRYGGEEMVVLLPNLTSDEALAVAERIRRSIAATPVGEIEVSASLGVSTLPDHAADGASLVSTADKAMYDAKGLGRNLVRRHGEPAPSSPTPRIVERKQPAPSWLSEEQKLKLRQRIVRGLDAECPQDGAPLTVHDATRLGSRGREYIVSCPDCGRSDRLLSPH